MSKTCDDLLFASRRAETNESKNERVVWSLNVYIDSLDGDSEEYMAHEYQNLSVFCIGPLGLNVAYARPNQSPSNIRPLGLSEV